VMVCKKSLLIVLLLLLLIQNSLLMVVFGAFTISPASAFSRGNNSRPSANMIRVRDEKSRSEAEDAAAYNAIFSYSVDLTSSYVRNDVLTGTYLYGLKSSMSFSDC